MTDFPYEELARFDSWAEASAAGYEDDQIWSVTLHDDTWCYGPPHHYVNHQYHVVTAERHDNNTYFEEEPEFYVDLEHRGEVIFETTRWDYGSIEELADEILDEVYYGEVSRSEPDGLIPNGCADYRIEVRTTRDRMPGICFEALDFFLT